MKGIVSVRLLSIATRVNNTFLSTGDHIVSSSRISILCRDWKHSIIWETYSMVIKQFYKNFQVLVYTDMSINTGNVVSCYLECLKVAKPFCSFE